MNDHDLVCRMVSLEAYAHHQSAAIRSEVYATTSRVSALEARVNATPTTVRAAFVLLLLCIARLFFRLPGRLEHS